MHKIAQATTTFAKLDETDDDALKALDQTLRHLTQRIPAFRPEGREGRADLFSTAAICALRLCYIADRSRFDRGGIERLAGFLLSDATGPARRVSVEGGFRPMAPIAEAIERIAEGQAFNLNVVLFADGRVIPSFDWPSDDPETASVVDRTFADAAPPQELARTVFPASRLIAELLAVLH